MHEYDKELLDGWEEVYKRGQLTLWILLALKDSPKHMLDIKQFIEQATESSLTADDKSIYRALRRYTQAEMITFVTEPSTSGPDRKRYSLTGSGSRVLDAFIKRNITIFYKDTVSSLIKG